MNLIIPHILILKLIFCLHCAWNKILNTLIAERSSRSGSLVDVVGERTAEEASIAPTEWTLGIDESLQFIFLS